MPPHDTPSPHCGSCADTCFPRCELSIPRLEKKDGKSGISPLAQICILPPVINKAVTCCSVKLTPWKLLSKIRHLIYLLLWCYYLVRCFFVEVSAHQQPRTLLSETLLSACALQWQSCMGNNWRNIWEQWSLQRKILGKLELQWDGKYNLSNFRWTSTFLEIPEILNFRAFVGHETSEEPLFYFILSKTYVKIGLLLIPQGDATHPTSWVCKPLSWCSQTAFVWR